MQTLLEYDTYMEGKDRNGLTVLHVAVAEEVSQTLQILLSRYVNFTATKYQHLILYPLGVRSMEQRKMLQGKT